MKRKLLVAAALCAMAVKPASAQVFDDVKAAKLGQLRIASQMESIDEKTIHKNNVATIGSGAGKKQIDRTWSSGFWAHLSPQSPIGYSYASAAERVAFALSYENWLRENGETSKDVSPLVPYSHRVSFAEQWWTKHSVARFRKNNPTEWAVASVADAGYLISETAKQLEIGGPDAARNEKELLAALAKTTPVISKDDIKIGPVAGAKSFMPELVAADKMTLGCSLKIGGEEVHRVWQSGYGGTTAAERARFAYDYLAYLNLHPPTVDGYREALVWSEQWWTDNCESYRDQQPGSSLSVSPYKAWARDSVVDALLLGYLANKELGLLSPDASQHFQLLVASAVECAHVDYESNDSKIPRYLIPN